MGSGRQNVEVNGTQADREFTVHNFDNLVVANKNTVDVQGLKRSLTDGIAREMGDNVKSVEDRMQNTILEALDNYITTWFELSVR